MVSSRTRVVHNVVTENSGSSFAALQSPAQLEAAAVSSESTKATPALPSVAPTTSDVNNKVITGSTIIFFDEDEIDEPADSADGDRLVENPAFTAKPLQLNGTLRKKLFAGFNVNCVIFFSVPAGAEEAPAISSIALPSSTKKKVASSSRRRRPTQTPSKNKVKNTHHNHRPGP